MTFFKKYYLKTIPIKKNRFGEVIYWFSYNELSQKQGFNLYQLRHCAYITYSVKI